MKKRLTMFLASLLLCVSGAFAQTQVNGTVLSQEDGQPIIGAAIKIVGKQVGMLTDVNGRRRGLWYGQEVGLHRFGCYDGRQGTGEAHRGQYHRRFSWFGQRSADSWCLW